MSEECWAGPLKVAKARRSRCPTNPYRFSQLRSPKLQRLGGALGNLPLQSMPCPAIDTNASSCLGFRSEMQERSRLCQAGGATDKPTTLCFSIRLAISPDFLACSTNAAIYCAPAVAGLLQPTAC